MDVKTEQLSLHAERVVLTSCKEGLVITTITTITTGGADFFKVIRNGGGQEVFFGNKMGGQEVFLT